MKVYKIKNLFKGKAKEYNLKDRLFKSAYEKELQEEIYLTKMGIKGDEQADKKNHGGENRALCIFTQDSYDFLNKKYNLHLKDCSFGENMTLLACKDEEIYIGDIFSCGETIVEVTQPRVPCWAISYITKTKGLTKILVEDFVTGFLLKVLKEGKIFKTDEFKLEKRVEDKFSIQYINQCYLNPKKYESEVNILLQKPYLAQAYKDTLKNRLENNIIGIEEFQKDIQ